MPPKRPESPSTAGPFDAKRLMTSKDVNPNLSLAITIADEDSDDPLRHLPAPIADGSNLRPVQIRPIPAKSNRATLTKLARNERGEVFNVPLRVTETGAGSC